LVDNKFTPLGQNENIKPALTSRTKVTNFSLNCTIMIIFHHQHPTTKATLTSAGLRPGAAPEEPGHRLKGHIYSSNQVAKWTVCGTRAAQLLISQPAAGAAAEKGNARQKQKWSRQIADHIKQQRRWTPPPPTNKAKTQRRDARSRPRAHTQKAPEKNVI
jgi:hypothetical protein